MGVLMGKGSFGRVYRGLWKVQLVAVKVQSLILSTMPAFNCSLL